MAGFVLVRSRMTGVRCRDGHWSFAFCALDDDTEIVSVALVRRDHRTENLRNAAREDEWCLEEVDAPTQSVEQFKNEHAVFEVGYADGTSERFAFVNFRG